MSNLILPERSGSMRVLFARFHWPLLILLSLITAIGVTALYSVAQNGSWSPWALRHGLRYGVAVILLVTIALIPLRYWLALSYPAYFVTLVLLLAVMLFGDVNMGAKRWLVLFGFNVQPSEIMKVTLVMALARYYHGVAFKNVSNFFFLIPPLTMIAIPMALVFRQPDLGTTILLGLTGGSIILLSGVSWRVIISGMVAVIIGAVASIRLGILKAYQLERFYAFLDTDADPLGKGYQLTQSKTAIGSGGVTGKGFMQGSQSQLDFLPEMHTDFIFTAFAEQFGLIGTLVLLGLYLGVFLIGTNVALRAKSHFGRLLTMGICLTFIMYVLINTGMVMGLMPIVGVPLPLVSYGGTVMIAIMGGFGLVMSSWIYRDEDTLRTNGIRR